jgi:Na+/H+-dicarboxylate symporter
MTLFESVDALSLRSLGTLVRPLQRLVEGRLWAKILLGMALGIGLGIVLGPTTGWLAPTAADVVGEWIALPGQLFLGMIQMIVVPLVFASIIRGLAASEGVDQLRKLGSRIAPYFLATTTIAVTIGLVAGYLIGPGNAIDPGVLGSHAGTIDLSSASAAGTATQSVPEMLTSLLPVNPLGAMVERHMLHVVVFAIFIGAALISMRPEQAGPLLSLLGSLQEVCMTLVRWAMLLAPVAVFGLLARLTLSMGLDALIGMAIYVGTVLAGLAVLFTLYLGIVAVVAKQSPWAFVVAIREVMLLAFSTSSSAAVMPLSIRTAEDKLRVRPSISQFIIPLGATINMDGTALYQAVATVFLAQVTGIDLTFAALVLVVVTTVGASIGSPSTPGVGIVLLSTILASVGIPAEAIALIIGVDRILDMSWIAGSEASRAQRRRSGPSMKNLVLRPARLPRTLGQRNGAPRQVRNASRTKAHYQPICVPEGNRALGLRHRRSVDAPRTRK